MLVNFLIVVYQIIQVNSTSPCFLNYSQGADIFHNCGFNQDYLQASLLGWEWITGGYFSLIFVSLFMGIIYIKYHKALYPILIGILFLPFAYTLFPNEWGSWAVIMATLGIIGALYYAFVHQTKEYDG